MATDCIAQTTFRFQQNSKPVVAAFDVAHASSDGGAVLLKAIDATLGLTARLADRLREARQPGKVRDQGIELLRQRVFGLALGYAGCNDAARLAHDPIHKLLLDRDPLTGAALGSQPTLSRFENGVRRGALYALGYAAKKWSHKRRVVMKAEVVRHPGRDPKNNPRVVVTNLPPTPAIYCARGDMENRLKELHHGLELDRTSCSRFAANQFRVLLTAAAYVLFQELQRRAQGTACAGAQVTTLRERRLKVAVWIERSVRRIVLHLPTAFPWLRPWQQLARAVGAPS
jgi:hypothetical protein